PIAVLRDDIRESSGVHCAPPDSLRGGRAGQSAPDDLIRGQLDEVIVAALWNAVNLPQRGLSREVEILRLAATENDAAVLPSGKNERAHLIDILIRLDHQTA